MKYIRCIAFTFSFKVEGMFSLARARNAAPIGVSTAIVASLASRVISHLGLDIPVVKRAHWARSIMTAAVVHAMDVAAARTPQVSCFCRCIPLVV